ncbi:MAG: DUF4982 domain-containing protein [Spirochaetales bacterium]|nr:DUF4982 domain-containing protein [Spirochaetales bacterium]
MKRHIFFFLFLVNIFLSWAELPRVDHYINDGWNTILGDPSDSLEEDFAFDSWEKVVIPHNHETYHGYKGLPHGNLHGTAWYRRDLEPELLMKGKKIFLVFEGAGSYATVFVNGQKAGFHAGGRTCFSVEISDFLKYDGKDFVSVKIDHPEGITDLPFICGACARRTEGSQPFGIFRPVGILTTEDIRISPFGVYVFSQKVSADLVTPQVWVDVANYSDKNRSIMIKNKIYCGNVEVSSFSISTEIVSHGEMTNKIVMPDILQPTLWSPEQPFMYRCVTEIYENGKILDSKETMTGFRTISWPISEKSYNFKSIKVGQKTVDSLLFDILPSRDNDFFTKLISNNKINVVSGIPNVQIAGKSITNDIASLETRVEFEALEDFDGVLDTFILSYDGTRFFENKRETVSFKRGKNVFVHSYPDLIKPYLWNFTNPFYYKVRSTIYDKSGDIVQMSETPFVLDELFPILNRQYSIIERSQQVSPIEKGYKTKAIRQLADARGFNGAGYYGLKKGLAYGRLYYNYDAKQAGTYSLILRFSNSSKFGRKASISVNDGSSYFFTLDKTLRDDAWEYFSLPIELNKGANDLCLTIRGLFGFGPLIDFIAVSELDVDVENIESSDNTSSVFKINGKPYFLNGTCEYEHLLGNDHAFTSSQIDSRVSQILATGFNAFRDAHHPHNLRYSEHWDNKGIIWWSQMTSQLYFDSDIFRKNFITLTREWVKERRNSPSLVLYGLENESNIPEWFAQKLTQEIKLLDPLCTVERPTTTCNGGVGSDWNVPQNWCGTYGGFAEDYGSFVVDQQLIGEYGAWRTLGLHRDGETTNAVSDYYNAYEEDFTHILETKVRIGEEMRDQFCGHFQWNFISHANPGRSETMTNDGVGDNAVGIVNYKGLIASWGEPVDAFYMYMGNYLPSTKGPFVYIVSHTWPDRWDHVGEKDNIRVYSNCDSVELFNGYGENSLGKRFKGAKGTHFRWDNANISNNFLYAVGYVDGQKVCSDIVVLNNLPSYNHPKLADQIEILKNHGDSVVRYNCGGGDYNDSFGNLWRGDHPFDGENGTFSWGEKFGKSNRFASVRETFDPISKTNNDRLFQSYRYGRDELSFKFTVGSGKFKVVMYFIEPWYGTGGGPDCSGWRLFDIGVNGKVYFANVDIFAAAGHDTAFSLTAEDVVADENGVVEINFPFVNVTQAVISAISINKEDI